MQNIKIQSYYSSHLLYSDETIENEKQFYEIVSNETTASVL